MSNLNTLVSFLTSLQLQPHLARIKTIEMDLRGNLNPTVWLNRSFFEQQRYLGFRDFFVYYVTQNEAVLRQNFRHIAWNELLQGLEARLYRTQFGMLTEYHAFFLCQHLLGEAAVRRSTDLDKFGVDFQVFFSSQTYNIHIFVDTPRAWFFRNQKIQHKQSNKLAGFHVNFPYSLAANRFNSLQFLSNGFGIYSEPYIRYLQQEISDGHIQNGNIVDTTATGFVYRT